MPLNPEILKLVETGKHIKNPTSVVNQTANTQTSSIIQSIKDSVGLAGAGATGNDPSAENTLRGKIAALDNELSSPRTATVAENQARLATKQRLRTDMQKELDGLNDGTIDLTDLEFLDVDGTTISQENEARKTYLQGRISELDGQIASFDVNNTSRNTTIINQDRADLQDQVRDRERSAAGAENFANQLGNLQSHTDTLLGDSTRITGIAAAGQVAKMAAGAERNCGDLLDSVGALTGSTDIIDGALGALGEIGDVLEDINGVLATVNQAKGAIENLIATDIATGEEILQAAKDGATAAVLSEINRDPCAAFLFNDVLGTPDLKKLIG
jgi:hypothetical protein